MINQELHEFLLDVDLLLVQSVPDNDLSLFRYVIETNSDPRYLPWWLSINHVYGFDGEKPVLDDYTKSALLGYIRARQTLNALRLSIIRKIATRIS